MAVENIKDEATKNTGNYRVRPSVIPPLTADIANHEAKETSEDEDESDDENVIAPLRHSPETRKLKRVRKGFRSAPAE